ncbi:hypothetical protein B0T24DRAFT_590838 [Lasiosphaeria ovina]|uniref:Uncharacterized protein n=1 Tax=Lasiosphaeria ovina TaxID=92902 RepID=A0AAE0TUN5_9PEZI|nr:hypothetical protein B0T24DRAFT_590838 [Lasiosphaeria ovina]
MNKVQEYNDAFDKPLEGEWPELLRKAQVRRTMRQFQQNPLKYGLRVSEMQSWHRVRPCDDDDKAGDDEQAIFMPEADRPLAEHIMFELHYNAMLNRSTERRRSGMMPCLRCAGKGLLCSLELFETEQDTRCTRCVRHGCRWCVLQSTFGGADLDTVFWAPFRGETPPPPITAADMSAVFFRHRLPKWWEEFWAYVRSDELTVEDVFELAREFLEGERRVYAGVTDAAVKAEPKGFALPPWHKNDAPDVKDDPLWSPKTWQRYFADVRVMKEQAKTAIVKEVTDTKPTGASVWEDEDIIETSSSEVGGSSTEDSSFESHSS